MNIVPRWDIYGRSQARILRYPSSGQYSPISVLQPYNTVYLYGIFTQYIPDKIRNVTRRTDQLSGTSQVMSQFRLYRCKGMSGTAALHIVCNQASIMSTKNGQKPSRGQIVKSQKISVFIMLSCWISPSNGNLLSRPNGTQTVLLCKFYL